MSREKQVDIRSASYRVLHDTPGHATYGVWINGGKCGDLTVRQAERTGFEAMMVRAGFRLMSALAILLLVTTIAAAGTCCAYKGRDAACVPCRPTEGV